MATAAAAACYSRSIFSHLPSPPPRLSPSSSRRPLPKPASGRRFASAALLAGGAGLALVASAQALPFGPPVALTVLQEPANALSLPTWAIHVSSVIEWITAMALVWEYGEKSSLRTWKGLSWGMVPLLGGALCACTWHFFYNSESLEILVALQAALTVIGNITMCIAAFRIFKASQEGSKSS
ncbi:ycf49-like protein [Cocos nucifera]|uniref:Ycf49-like protein n=1 Tax=Cocos nucifera TaxID=13894 RepID=A0A8K0IIJ0_COCNU|nr:ycf49-like protein [Cocos nucifera]